MNEPSASREHMVEAQLRQRGITSPTVLAAMAAVPRERFIPNDQQSHAYDDTPLPIGCGQTISQPYMVATMTEALDVRPRLSVLEVGTGSGYQTAILALLGAAVFSVERCPQLARQALERLTRWLGPAMPVRVCCADGSLGWPEWAPYDRILVTAAAPHVPDALLDQLGRLGRLVVPIGPRQEQLLLIIDKLADGSLHQQTGTACRFVPLIGLDAWPNPA